MGTEKWLQELLNKLRERMGDEYQVKAADQSESSTDGRIQIGIMKSGERTGILLSLDVEKSQRLKKGIGLEDAVTSLAERYFEKRNVLREEVLMGDNFQIMKEKVIYALERKEGNEEALARIPWESCLDMALVFYLVDTPEGEASYRAVNNKDLEVWKVSREDIRKLAEKNTPKFYPPLVLSIEEADSGRIEEDGVPVNDLETYLIGKTEGFILTNQHQFYGASTILYDGVLGQMATALHDDLFVIPTSINEVMIVPVCGSWNSISEWRNMVRALNQEPSQKAEALSDSVYYYNREEGKLRIAGDKIKMIFD